MIYVGIDPGKRGGLGFLDGGHAWGDWVDTTDGSAIRVHLRDLEAKDVIVGIEVPVGRPPQHGGWKQISQQWRAIGVAEGVVMGLGLPLVRVSPKDWRRLVEIRQPKNETYEQGKKRVLAAARQRWPQAGLDRVKDQPIADALYIAASLAGKGKEEA